MLPSNAAINATYKCSIPFAINLPSVNDKLGLFRYKSNGGRQHKKPHSKELSKKVLMKKGGEVEDPSYRIDQHGPLYCINSVTRELYNQINPNNNFDGINQDVHKSLRSTFISKTIWEEVGSKFERGRTIPFYRLKDQRNIKHIGLEYSHLSRWLVKTFASRNFPQSPSTLDNPSAESRTESILDKLKTESTSWKTIARIKFDGSEGLKDALCRFDRLEGLRCHYEKVLTELSNPQCPIKRFVSLDIEAYELSQRKLTEFGITVYDRELDWPDSYHIIIREHAKLRNSCFAKDAKDDFAFGKSMAMCTGEAMKFLTSLLAEPGTALIGHSLNCDLNFLRRATLPRGKKGSRIEEDFLATIPQYDLQYLFRCRNACERHSKLSDICEDLGLAKEVMHNAGNDAALTLAAFLCLTRITTASKTDQSV